MKRSIAVLVAVALIVSFTVDFGAVAAATNLEEEQPHWAIAAEGGTRITGVSDSDAASRKLLGNALGEPDSAYADYLSKSILSARYYSGLTFEFDSAFVNRPDSYDLVISEVTLGAWHPEAIEVILLGAVGADGDLLNEDGTISIGIVFNSIGNMLYQSNNLFKRYVDDNGIKLAVGTCKLASVSSELHVSFPDEVYSAEKIRVVDKSQLFNSEAKAYLEGNSTTFTAKHTNPEDGTQQNVKYKPFATSPGAVFRNDGFDIDAIGVFCESFLSDQLISAFAFDDQNSDGIFDFDEFGLQNIRFELYGVENGNETLITTAESDETGFVNFGAYGAGEYIIRQLPAEGWNQTTYPGGAKAVIVSSFAQYELEPSQEDLGIPHFGNCAD